MRLCLSTLCLFVLVVYLLATGCSFSRDIPKNSTWQSASPDMWFTFNLDETTIGKLNYDGEVIKVEVALKKGLLGLFAVDIWKYGITNANESRQIFTEVISCSKTKLVLNVTSSYLQGFNKDKQIFFERTD